MTEFQGKQEAPEKEPVKVELPTSRVRNDPELWKEACVFADMLTFCRPHLSKTERKFIAKFLVPVGVKFDKKGNAYKQIGDNPVVLWSSHVDTVHTKQGPQKIEYTPHKTTGDTFFQVAGNCKSSCLGADDTTGIWLMLEMIKANVPGLYIFHRGEEVGRKGSLWIAEHNKEALKGIKYAIAFDRKGEKSIITYQMSKRCCSDEFAESLAGQLGMGHEKDTGGSYTDTASYVDLIPECTNISAGYINAHCWDEMTNVDYLFRLRDALVNIDVNKLVEKRKPGENTALYTKYTYSGYDYDWERHWSSDISLSQGYSSDELEKKHGKDWFRKGLYKWNSGTAKYHEIKKEKTGGLTWYELLKKHKGKNWKRDDYLWDSETCKWYPNLKAKQKNFFPQSDEIKRTYTFKDAMRWIEKNPEVIADLLDTCGYGPKELLEYLTSDETLGFTIHL